VGRAVLFSYRNRPRTRPRPRSLTFVCVAHRRCKGWSLRLRLLSSSIFDLCLRGAPQMQRLEPSLTPSSSSIFDLCLRGAPQMQRLEPSLTSSSSLRANGVGWFVVFWRNRFLGATFKDRARLR
jgi:hypothetical protein